MKPPRRIELHVEHVVCEGFARSDGYRIASALERELTRLFSGGRMDLSNDRRIESISVGQVQMTSTAATDQLAERLAAAIHGGLAT
jgi:hypothetical protein